jgi:hypothetical protein
MTRNSLSIRPRALFLKRPLPGQKPTQPDPIADLFHAHGLTREHGAEHDFVPGHADALVTVMVRSWKWQLSSLRP